MLVVRRRRVGGLSRRDSRPAVCPLGAVEGSLCGRRSGEASLSAALRGFPRLRAGLAGLALSGSRLSEFETRTSRPPRYCAAGRWFKRMAAMVAPHVDSVQTHSLRAARGRSARGFGQKPTRFESALDRARGSATRPRGPATLAPPPAHTLPASRPPQNRAHAKHTPRQHTPRLRKSKSRPHAGRRGARAAATLPPRSPPHARSPPPNPDRTRAATQNRNRTGPRTCRGTSPASPRTTTTSTSSSATARRKL